MTDQNKNIVNQTFHGKRRLSLSRKIYYFFGLPLLKILIKALTCSYKIQIKDDDNTINQLIESDNIYAPCYWHQQTLVSLHVVSLWLKKGFKGGFIVSPSVDGEVPAKIAKSWGAKVIRGSAVRTGATAMRQLHSAMKEGTSIVTAADGPLGPIYQFKSGVVLMAKIGNAPIIPIVCASSSSWLLNRWDRFMIPKPFSKIIISIVKPYKISKNSDLMELEEHRINIQTIMNKEMKNIEKQLENE